MFDQLCQQFPTTTKQNVDHAVYYVYSRVSFNRLMIIILYENVFQNPVLLVTFEVKAKETNKCHHRDDDDLV
jgi:hypothetical protein